MEKKEIPFHLGSGAQPRQISITDDYKQNSRKVAEKLCEY